MTTEIRPVTEDELPTFQALTSYAFADNQTDEERRAAPIPMLADWTMCAFVDGRLATSFAAYPFRVRLNGASVAMSGVTAVATAPEFRRRGLLRSVMVRALADQRERGEAFAILRASLGAIYQRYGYGMACSAVSYEIDPRTIVFTTGAPASGRMRLYPVADARPILLALYRDFARPRNLMIQRAPLMWDVRLRDQDGRTHVAVYETGGEARGYVVFQLVRGRRPGPGPDQDLVVLDAAWLDLDAYRGLWDFFVAHDLAGRVLWDQVPEDDPAPFLLLEPRELRRRTRDGVWMRVTDVESALRSRSYAVSGGLTIRVVDPLLGWNDATFTLETTGPERDAVRTDAEPDLTMPVSALAVLVSGHRSARFLANAGLLEADGDEALDRADRMFATAYAPWCSDPF